LQKLISQLQARIERTKQKIAAANTAEDTVTEVTPSAVSTPILVGIVIRALF
jgi:hypothetical protein